MKEAIAALVSGAPIVIPTDTVYGIAALPELPDAIAAIFRAKGRSEDKPLPILGDSLAGLSDVAVFDERARRVGEAFWPGPLTLVLPRARSFTADLGSATDTVAVRVPASDVALELLAKSGPLAVTSANRSGSPPATTVDEARAALGEHVMVFVDGGLCNGSPSTVVAIGTEIEVLRAGPISLEDVAQAATS